MSYSGVDPTMSPEEGRMNQVSWIEDLFSSIDRMDTDAFMGFLSDAPVFQFGNAPPVEGREAVREAVAGFFAAIRGIEHRLIDSWDMGDAAVCRGRVRYERHDGSALSMDALFDPREAVKAKALPGGTSPDAVRASLDAALARLDL